MRSTSFLVVAALALAVVACDDNPLKSALPETPPPPSQGIQAFVQVDNTAAEPGAQIHVFVRAQLGTENTAKLGSYTGRLTFDPTVLAYVGEVKINDGLRVSNPAAAGQGQLRFAGAAAGGFANLTLYEGIFDVRKADYLNAFNLSMEELSAAGTLQDLKQQLAVPTQIYLRKSGR